MGRVPLRLVKAMKCTKMMCPSGWAPKPALNAGENAVLHLCHSQTCTTEDDSTRCCREAGTPCQDFGLAFGCPSDSFLFDMGFCHRSPCVAQDHRFCCQHIKQDQEEQQFDMTKGIHLEAVLICSGRAMGIRAAAITGVKTNGAGDLSTFLTGAPLARG
ncbi:unnamed protein product [Effrenium voratum]|uniref:Uncharacterized protein n=1 Tax=Effrenium voratum TaxID=2562239 RepID=A0AA36JL69_9DINO|nr:unnamed protein product [Effrenium voratum]